MHGPEILLARHRGHAVTSLFMENNDPAQIPPAVAKKGLGTGAKIGIGCGVVALLAVIAFVVATVFVGGKLKEFADEAQKNPTRAAASMMVKASVGNMEMVAEDDVNKRYTVKETKTGKLTTVYWNEKTKAPEIIEGDFSAIPAVPAGEAAQPPK